MINLPFYQRRIFQLQGLRNAQRLFQSRDTIFTASLRSFTQDVDLLLYIAILHLKLAAYSFLHFLHGTLDCNSYIFLAPLRRLRRIMPLDDDSVALAILFARLLNSYRIHEKRIKLIPRTNRSPLLQGRNIYISKELTASLFGLEISHED
ncbi:hypothetical protein V441_19700 [Pseudomonas aeruginosa DHS29]|nr:hypothetical protein T223_09585 [Pseudomonas aeruginosa LES431]AHH53066.1 hypothetical protein AI22_24295 [Pseudomonas aeruginosa YL84]AHK86850.1 hypothetical protein T227_09905 [Pseudomonas aeruginosa LESlike5]AHK92724.1 hypothetical protein T228_09590 [Pseudomonas aeruginosa LESlike7]AHK98728.1 hypothetical protein T222_09915 [Pseudomonas aeruginosa LES400]AHL04692.1 hypothetical protein T224_09900 [Pseudomonas aeruginosa LESB65]AHL10616.1 hypothetical protein T225_09905 [Pseudomonas aer